MAQTGEIDFDNLHTLLGYHLRRAQVAVFKNFAEAVGAEDISPGLFGALTIIGGNGEAWPVTIRIASLAGEFGTREHLLAAGAFISTVIPLLVFFSLQRFFVRGILAGSVKG